jgi:hypothetical protein
MKLLFFGRTASDKWVLKMRINGRNIHASEEGGGMVEFENGTIQVGAEDIAGGLAMTPEAVMQGFRDGSITSLCEKGAGQDAGRHRLTFQSPLRRLRLVVSADGAILKRSSADCRREMFGLTLKRTRDQSSPNPASLAPSK